MAYTTIDGIKYEKELLDLAEKHTTGRGESKISADEAVELIASAKDGGRITEIEKNTLVYIRKHYQFTFAAAQYFDNSLDELQHDKCV